jgi:hypothetical protein
MRLSKQYDAGDNSARKLGPVLAHLVHNGLIIEISERPSRRRIMKREHRCRRFGHCFNFLFKSAKFSVADSQVNEISAQSA